MTYCRQEPRYYVLLHYIPGVLYRKSRIVCTLFKMKIHTQYLTPAKYYIRIKQLHFVEKSKRSVLISLLLHSRRQGAQFWMCIIFNEFYFPEMTCLSRILNFHSSFCTDWPRGLGYKLSSLARTPGSWVWIPLKTWMSVLCLFCLCFSAYRYRP
jgi:hypothetical protein